MSWFLNGMKKDELNYSGGKLDGAVVGGMKMEINRRRHL